MYVTILARYSRVLAAALGAAAAAIVLAVVFAGLAVADHDDSTRFQAESMTYGPFARVVSDPSAFGGQALRYTDPGRASRSVTLPSEGERVVIRARQGADAGSRSSVGLRVLVDGVVVGEQIISSSSYAYYSLDTSIPKGTHKIGVEGYSLRGSEKAHLDDVRIVHNIVHKSPSPDAQPPVQPVWTQAPSGTVTAQPLFSWSHPEQGVTFECKLNDDAWTACTSPVQLDVSAGLNYFSVRAKDGAGNLGPARTRAFTLQTPAQTACEGKQVPADGSLDERVNSDPSGTATTFCLAPGTHRVTQTVVPKAGDKILGPEGEVVTRGPAKYGVGHKALIRPDGSLTVITRPVGANIEVAWVDISGATGAYEQGWAPGQPCANPSDDGQSCPRAGTGVAMTAGTADGTLSVHHVKIHGNDAVGIANAKGRIKHSEFTNNTKDGNFAGFTGGGVKGITEFEAGYNYSHDEQANGLWADHGTENDPAMSGNPGSGAWFHDNLVVNNGRWGIRYEYSARLSDPNLHLSQPSFMAEDNVMAGNGAVGSRGGASIHDAQNGTIRNNRFEPVTINGVSYGHNAGNRAVVVADGGSRRTDTWNAAVTGNSLGGETVQGCTLGAGKAYCSDNR